MKSAPDIVRAARRVPLLRKTAWPVYKLYRKQTASGIAPPIIINSIPKAGTHLVASVLSRVPRVAFSGRIITHHDVIVPGAKEYEGDLPRYDAQRLRVEVNAVPRGTFANCHLYYDEYTESLLTSPDVSALFIVRDPRDILISFLTYIEQFRGHHFHHYLTSEFANRAERLDALIYGWEPNVTPKGVQSRGLADLGTRLRAFNDWSYSIPTFRFEEFTSAPDAETLDHSLSRLLEAAGLANYCDVESVKRGIGDKWSATFHRATSGGWKKVLSARQIAAVDELAGDFLIKYGYE